MDRRDFILASAAVAASGIAGRAGADAGLERVPVLIETQQRTGALRHVWSESAGSDRAAITMRESWRKDLDRWTTEAGLKRVRFHGILNDELGVYAPSIQNRGKPAPNFRNVFEVYDGLIERGVQPFVELSFMPQQLASGTANFGFYKGNITPPKSLPDWSAFITTFARAMADRYSIIAVRDWMFEVWNEPDLPFFWAGKQQDYFDLYKATAVALKSVDPQIKVGGPATSGGKRIGEFTAYCAANNAPLDFIATHAYAGGNHDDRYGNGQPYSVNQVIPDIVADVRRTIDASQFRNMPLWLTEWSSDSPAMIAHTIKKCLPMVAGMSQWVLSGTYEELGVFNYLIKEGDMGWATLTRGIARPSFNTYKLLHALGSEQLAGDGPVLASLRGRTVSALVWNLAEVQQAAGIPGASAERKVSGTAKRLDVRFAGVRPGARARVLYVDQARGSAMPAWRAMGSPPFPTMAQIEKLRQAAEIAAPVTMTLDRISSISLDLPPEGVALIEVDRV